MTADGARPRIGLIDYGVGNRRSMEKSLERAGADVLLSGDRAALMECDGVVLPGVGAFATGMSLLRERGLDTLVKDFASTGRPVIGACLGMQLLLDGSDEFGGAEGLGLIAGKVTQLDTDGLNLPHIGWNGVRWERDTPLSEGLAGCDPPRPFYHVHSFAPVPEQEDSVLGTSDYGKRFVSVVGRANVMGTQFHPEKSSRDGIRLLSNFVRLCANAEVTAQ